MFTQSFITNLGRFVIQNMKKGVLLKMLYKTIVFCHLGSINWGKMIGLLMSALNVALFHHLE